MPYNRRPFEIKNMFAEHVVENDFREEVFS